MTPISSSPGWITRKPNMVDAPAATAPGFTAQLQDLLQRTKTPQADPAQATAPSRATTGSLHPGGMNDVVHQLLKLGGKT